MRTSNPVPTQIKQLRGTYRDDRDGQKVIISPIDKVPDPPDSFTEDQANTWIIICNTLLKAGLLQDVNVHLLKMYFDQLEIYRKAQEDLAASGMIITYKMRYGDVTKINPSYQVAQNALKYILDFASQFGLTPLAQSKIKITNPGPIEIDSEFGF